MSGRSYLDEPEDGSQQSGYTTLEQLSRCLDALDERLGKSRDKAHNPDAPRDEPASERPLPQRQREARQSYARLDDFDGSLGDLPSGPEHGDRVHRLSALADRLEEIAIAVDSLPETLSLRALEEKLRTLATAIEHLVSRPPAFGAETFTQIEVRLDEISSAIAASTVAAQSPQVDPEPFQRIEARVAALAGQIEEVARERPAGQVVERLGALSQSVDEIAARLQLPERALERLSGQVAAIAEKIDMAARQPDAEKILSGIEQRFDLLSRAFERRHGETIDQGSLLMREIGWLLDEVTGRLAEEPAMPDRAILLGMVERFDALEQRQHDALEQGSLLLHELERRFEGVTERLESRQSVTEGITTVDARLAALAARLEERGEGVAGLEGRLEDMSQRLDRFAGRLAGLHSDLIDSLEAQAAGLSTLLSRPAAPLPGPEIIGPRLDAIEKHLANSGDRVLEAACRAAENAVHQLAGNQADDASVAALADRLKALEALVRRSDVHSSTTFEALNGTLLRIVDRLGTSEGGPNTDPGDGRQAGHLMPVAGETDPPLPSAAEKRPPAEPTAAASKSLDAAVLPPSGQRRFVRTMLGGLFAERREHPAQRPREAEAESRDAALTPVPPVSIDPRLANRPLEPGSRPPGLDAPVRRLRVERAQAVAGIEAPVSDFIAAARRAAQAAAEEADALKRKSDVSGPMKVLHIVGFLKSGSKPLLMAGTGIALALAGMELGKAFVSDPVPTAMQETSPMSGKAARDAALLAGSTSLRRERLPTLAAADGGARPGSSGRVASPSSRALAFAGEVPATAGPAALRRAANSGDPAALFEVASRLAEGRGTTKDLPEAARWFEKAAELGLAPAQFRIGNFYEKGIGVARDIAKSKAWYERAAEQGNAGAMHNLAVLLAMGADGDVDSEGAASWFVSAAELGVQHSQFNLGVLAGRGVGMQRNLEESYKWFALAARSGDEDAVAKREEIARALQPEQLDRARAAVQQWKPEPLDAGANAVDVPKEWLDGGAALTGVKALRDVRLILGTGFETGRLDGAAGARARGAAS